MTFDNHGTVWALRDTAQGPILTVSAPDANGAALLTYVTGGCLAVWGGVAK